MEHAREWKEARIRDIKATHELLLQCMENPLSIGPPQDLPKEWPRTRKRTTPDGNTVVEQDGPATVTHDKAPDRPLIPLDPAPNPDEPVEGHEVDQPVVELTRLSDDELPIQHVHETRRPAILDQSGPSRAMTPSTAVPHATKPKKGKGKGKGKSSTSKNKDKNKAPVLVNFPVSTIDTDVVTRVPSSPPAELFEPIVTIHESPYDHHFVNMADDAFEVEDEFVKDE
jgi:hypothetical protein